MGKYSLIELRIVIPYETIEGEYRIDGKIILFVTFLVIVYLKYY